MASAHTITCNEGDEEVTGKRHVMLHLPGATGIGWTVKALTNEIRYQQKTTFPVYQTVGDCPADTVWAVLTAKRHFPIA
jgi:hypothetical protein